VMGGMPRWLQQGRPGLLIDVGMAQQWAEVRVRKSVSPRAH